MNRKLSVFVFLIGLFVVSLFVGGETKSASVEKKDFSASVVGNGLDVYFFYGQGCPHCTKVEPFLAEMAQKYPLQLHKFDIYTNRSCLSLFGEYSNMYGLPLERRGVPTVFVSDTYFVGDTPIFDGFEEVVEEALQEENSSDNQSLEMGSPEDVDQGTISMAGGLSILTVTVAALVDAISPCSIAILVFLIGARVLVANRRKRALKVGLAFCLSVFIAYFLFGLGLFTVVQVSGFSNIFSLLVGLIAVLAGMFYIKDVFWHDRGRFKMEVPGSLKPLLMKMLKGVTSPFGAFVMGFVVCLFELPCTGGPYLFILGQLANTATRLQAVPLLLYYNFIFVLPLIIISLFLYSNFLSIGKVRGWSDNNKRLLKLVGGFTMMTMGFLVIPISQMLQFMRLFLHCFKTIGPAMIAIMFLYSFASFAKQKKLGSKLTRLPARSSLLLSLMVVTVFIVPSSTNLLLEQSNRASASSLDVSIENALESRKLAFLFFYMDGCPWCRKQKSVIDELEPVFSDDVVFIRVNSERNLEATREFAVQGFPSMFLIYGKDETGYLYKSFRGYTTVDVLQEALMQYRDLPREALKSYNFVLGNWGFAGGIKRKVIRQYAKLELPFDVFNETNLGYDIHLKSRRFVPTEGLSGETGKMIAQLAKTVDRVHVIIQFYHMPDENEKIQLEKRGIQLLSYLPNYAFLISIPAKNSQTIALMPNVRAITQILCDDKISPYIRENNFGDWSENPDGTVNLSVQFFEDVSWDNAEQVIKRHNGIIKNRVELINSFVVTISKDRITALACEDSVHWIEEVPPPPILELDQSRPSIEVDIVQAPPYNLDGSNVQVLVYDGGEVDDTHDDFDNRVTVVDTGGISNHATHVAGIIGGNGDLSNGKLRGMAPNVDIISYDSAGYWYDEVDDILNEYSEAINVYGVDVASNSWGYPAASVGQCDREGDYTSVSEIFDGIVRGGLGRRIIVVFSGGNERSFGTCGTNGYWTVNPPKPAKNIIAVGGINSNDDSMTDFSSWGPVDDGRIKPDLVAPACQVGEDGGINSTVPGDKYSVKCGTSMAAPHVTGTLTLMLQQWRTLHGTDPYPSTLKAILIQTASDLGNKGPDYKFGYGKINAKAAVDLIRDDNGGLIFEDGVGYLQVKNYYMSVPAGASNLKVTLVWDDPPGDPFASKEIVNDLDLLLIAPDGSLHNPWTLDPSVPSADARRDDADGLNNVEQVEVDTPQEGIWRIAVVGGPPLPVSPQDFSIVLSYSGCIDDDNDGWAGCYGDCDDDNPLINPDAQEVCDGVDNNCDGTIDEGCSCIDGQTMECGPGTDVGECQNGVQTCVDGQWGPCEGAVWPVDEACDGKDNDCDGQIDEGDVCGGGGVEIRPCSPSDKGDYEECWEVRYPGWCNPGEDDGCCGVYLPVARYTNYLHDFGQRVNEIQWGPVSDSWDPYVLNQYRIAWGSWDVARVYYDVNNPETDCGASGCTTGIDYDSDPAMIVTVNAPGVAHHEYIVGWDRSRDKTTWCAVWYYPFNPNYGADNQVHALNCFEDADCSLGEYCDKSGGWSSWSCKSCPSVECYSDSDCPSDGCYSGTYRDYQCVNPGRCNSACEYVTTITDHDHDGHDIECDGDCDDNNPTVHPGGTELCDNLDNDCDTLIDEDLTRQCGITDVGECQYGTQTCTAGSWGECIGCVNPVPEVCDGKDNDCDGTIDNGVCDIPQWRDQGQNNSRPLRGETVLLYARARDGDGLDYAWLQTNETGVWKNNAILNMNGTRDWTWSQFAWQNASVLEGTTVAWRIHYNDTIGTENVTNTMTFTIKSPYNIAVTNVVPSKTVVGQGYCINITVTVENQGVYTECFNVTVFYDETAITLPNGKNHTTTTLTSGNSTTITLTWNTTGVAKGNYTISAYAEPVPGETDTTDNTLVYGIVKVTTPGDINGDFKVDIYDFPLLMLAYGSRPGDWNWLPNADINCDLVVDHLDRWILWQNIQLKPGDMKIIVLWLRYRIYIQ